MPLLNQIASHRIHALEETAADNKVPMKVMVRAAYTGDFGEFLVYARRQTVTIRLAEHQYRITFTFESALKPIEPQWSRHLSVISDTILPSSELMSEIMRLVGIDPDDDRLHYVPTRPSDLYVVDILQPISKSVDA